MIFEGTVHEYGRDVDTDVIIPARYLNTNDPAELARHCMEDIDADFVDLVQPGDIIVADRELRLRQLARARAGGHQASGISVVVASSFARIFYRNAINTGPADRGVPRGGRRSESRRPLRVDLVAGTVENLTQGTKHDADAVPAVHAGVDRSRRAAALRQVARGRRERLVTTPPDFRGYRVMTLPGDGVGPEIVAAARRVLDAAGQKYGFLLAYEEGVMGGCAIDAFGDAHGRQA